MDTMNFVISTKNAERLEQLGIQASVVASDGDNPRDWDNLGIIVTRRGFGDEQYPSSVDIGNNVDETIENYMKYIGVEADDYLALPIYKYEHSGVALNTTGFSCRWDSGVYGFIYVTKKSIRECFGVKRVTKEIRDRTYKCLEGEVATLGMWMNGEVYGCSLEKDGTEIDSIYGLFGDDAVNEFINEVLAAYADEPNPLAA